MALKKKAAQRPTKKEKAPVKKIRYAVVGMGHIVQVAVLPAFKAVRRSSELVALVSGTPKKLRQLSRQYKVPVTASYDQLEEVIKKEAIDVVFIGLPNSLHEEYTLRSLDAGAHVLCEKPLSSSVESATRMQSKARECGKQLMTAYRLHFDPTYTAAMEAIHKGEIGEVLSFTSTFSFQIKKENVRLEQELGGGALLDIGVYCINATRSVFRDEPESVFASFQNPDERFNEVDGAVTATLKFAGQRTAQFVASFGMSDRAWFEVVGTKGSLRMEPAYEYAEPLSFTVEGKKPRKVRGKKVDQFAGEIEHFSRSLIEGEEVRADGDEGIADLVVIEALRRSAASGKAEKLRNAAIGDYAQKKDAEEFPGHGEPENMVDVDSASNS